MQAVDLSQIREKLLLDVKSRGPSFVKSSHWREHTNKFSYENSRVTEINGFSGRSRRYPFSNYLHRLLQQILWRDAYKVFLSRWYSLAAKASLLQGRSIDLCLFRNTCTFWCVDQHIDLDSIDTICVIGDGQSNFVSLAILSGLFKNIVSVNLPEILLSDLELIDMLRSKQGVEFMINYCNTESELGEALQQCNKSKKRLGFHMVNASNCSIIKNMGIGLFVNIASMQEMTSQQIKIYFDIIKSNQAIFYCCNRKTKVMYGGECTSFKDYPWGECSVKFDELCPWHQKFYAKKLGFFPTLKQYEGEHLHRLVKY